MMSSSSKSDFREWYIENACSEHEVERLLSIQATPNAETYWPVLSKYFGIWSHLGSGAFYILLLCLFAWCGYPVFAAYMCISLSVGLYTTDVIKDALACPRPPSPPVFRGGTASHALEYGFPSTHTACACILAHCIVAFFSISPQTRTIRYQFPSTVPSGHIREDHSIPSSNNVSRVAAHGLPLNAEESVASAQQLFLIACAFFFVFHVAYSRMYLGLHWLGDIAGGLVVYFAWAVADVLFLHRFLTQTLLATLPSFVLPPLGSGSGASHASSSASAFVVGDGVFSLAAMILVPIVVGLWLLELHSTPRDACPCFEDSARFVGADCGLVIGSWFLRYDMLLAQLRGDAFSVDVPLLFNNNRQQQQQQQQQQEQHSTASSVGAGAFFYVFGVVLLIAAQELSVKMLPSLLRPLLRFISGHSLRSLPSFLHVPYKLLCAATGTVFFLRKPPPLSSLLNVVSSHSSSSSSSKSPSADVSSSTAHSVLQQELGDSATSVVDVHASTSSSFPSSAAVVVALEKNKHDHDDDDDDDVPHDASNATSAQQSSGDTAAAVWSTRCHTHWDEDAIMSKFLSYVVLGFCAAYTFPMFLYPGMHSLWNEMTDTKQS